MKFSEDKTFSKEKDENKGNDIICYECKKSGHIKLECPLLKKRKESRKEEKTNQAYASYTKE